MFRKIPSNIDLVLFIRKNTAELCGLKNRFGLLGLFSRTNVDAAVWQMKLQHQTSTC
jgi:hypothetical protein